MGGEINTILLDFELTIVPVLAVVWAQILYGHSAVTSIGTAVFIGATQLLSLVPVPVLVLVLVVLHAFRSTTVPGIFRGKLQLIYLSTSDILSFLIIRCNKIAPSFIEREGGVNFMETP